MKRFLGIDPGLHGAFCVLTADAVSHHCIDTWFCPFPTIDNEIDFKEMRRIFASLGDCTAILEKVSAMPKQGVSSMFKFGRVFGSLQCALHIFQIPHREVTPQAWQKVLHEGVSRDLDPKKRSLLVAQRLFPMANLLATERSRVPHDGYVDALLLAEYGRRASLGSGETK